MEAFFEIIKNRNILEDFHMGEEISSSNKNLYTKRKAVHKKSEIERTIKIVNKKKIHKYNEFVQKLDKLRVLDHPNLCKIFDIYEDTLNFYFIEEYIPGGDLFEAIL